MTVSEILQSVQFVVGQDGQPKAAILDMNAWESFLSLLENLEDIQLVRDRMNNWRSKEGWTRWEDFAMELDNDELSSVD